MELKNYFWKISLVISEFFKGAILLTPFHARTVEIAIILISFSKPLKGGFFLESLETSFLE